MNTKKQEAIKNAYLEFISEERFNEIESKISNDGWIHYDYLHEVIYIKDLFDNDIDYYRPKQLQGIEYNNGWISMLFKEPPYPEHDVEYWIITNGIMLKCKWNMVRKEFINVHGLQENVTHWQPIIKPLKPLY